LPILPGDARCSRAAQAAGGNSDDDAAQAAMASAMGLMQQRQIDYTRSNESEADRLGIQTLARSNYDPEAMADFFATLQARSRSNGANYWGESPDWLMTHPVTITRITEAKERAAKLKRDKGGIAEVCVRDPDGPAAMPHRQHRQAAVLARWQQQPAAAAEPGRRHAAQRGRAERRHRSASSSPGSACACSAPTLRAMPCANTSAWPAARTHRRPALRPGRGPPARQQALPRPTTLAELLHSIPATCG
jgi:predicted Zn-dependent protease